MSVWLNPKGRASYGLAICARCARKFFLDQLSSDPNAPGLMVCAKDRDVLDPWRLPAPTPENISLAYVRPDDSIGTDPAGTITEDGDAFITTEDGDSYLIP